MLQGAHCSHQHINSDVLLCSSLSFALIDHTEDVQVPNYFAREELSIFEFHWFEEEWLRKGCEQAHKELLALQVFLVHFDIFPLNSVSNANIDPPLQWLLCWIL